MATVKITIKVCRYTTTKEIWAASVDGVVVYEGRDPWFDVCRVLKAAGHSDDTIVEMYHEGSSTLALTGKIGSQIGFTVRETERGRPTTAKWAAFVTGGVGKEGLNEADAPQ